MKRLIFTSGKHYYNLSDKRDELKRNDVALIRLESLCPFPARELQEILKIYGNATEVIWSQEEHQNMGAWTFIRPRFENILGRQVKDSYANNWIRLRFLNVRFYCITALLIW